MRRFFFLMHLISWSQTASFVRICPLCLLNPHRLQQNSASFMHVRIIYEVANTVWLIEWQILWLSDKAALSYYLRHRVKSGMLPSFPVLKYIISLQLLINVLKGTIRPSHGHFCCMQASAFRLTGFIFSAFFFFYRSKWLKGTNWLQTWLRLQLSFQKWQAADLSAWHWAIGHRPWQMHGGTKMAGNRGRQNTFGHQFFLSVITAGQQPVEAPVSLFIVVLLYPVLWFES